MPRVRHIEIKHKNKPDDCPKARQISVQPTERLHYLVSQVGKRAKLKFDITPHLLRHSTGYFLANKGYDTRLIQDYLGHKNTAHTVRYTRKAAGRFDGLWR